MKTEEPAGLHARYFVPIVESKFSQTTDLKIFQVGADVDGVHAAGGIMDAVDYRDHLRASAGRMKWWREVEEQDGAELVKVVLRGKAPWGFTLRGGTEHQEPLVITKVEAGSVAAAAGLRAGDAMVSVNAAVLCGSRQEAICLVKSSHKTLTLVVRRKNDPNSRPHSWHSSKLTEEEADPAKREASPAPVWQPQHGAKPEETSKQGEQITQQQQAGQFSSVSNMERLERPSHPCPPDRLSPVKYAGTAQSFSEPGGKRDSAFSCLSSGSSPPIHDPRKGTSSENIFFKGIQSEGPLRYLQPALGNGGWDGSRPDDQPASRVSIAGRAGIGPVWQVPEKKKSQSPPPPPPPLRSDSFVATKVFPYSEGPGSLAKSHGRSVEKLTDGTNHNSLRTQQEKTSESRHSFNPVLAKEFPHPNKMADHNHNQLQPNKLFSLSSCDVRQSHYTQLPVHQRQYSDESPFYLHNRTAPPAKTQSVGSYYRSLQDLPTNALGRKHVRHSTASSAINANPETAGHSKYWQNLAGKHSVQTTEHKARQSKVEGWRGETEKSHRVQNTEAPFSSSSMMNVKAKYSLPHSQMPYSENKERNSHSHLGNGLHYDNQASEDAAKRSDSHFDIKKHLPAHQQSSEHKICLTRHQNLWVPQEDNRISPLKTPLLHSLAQESRSLFERQPASTTVVSTLDASDNMAACSGKVSRRSDRYATTLRKEIQQKRAQLQKSRSAATLTCDAGDEDTEEWRSMEASTSSAVSFSNTYKDHLKEAQARVLKATSFQRRDLEPAGPEAPTVKASSGRIRGRKRFHLAKRTHSFSEPDKIDKLGMEGESQPSSLGEQEKLFETKPSFSRPVLKSGPIVNQDTDLDETGTPKEGTQTGEPDDADPSVDPSLLSPRHRQLLLEQQRLGTFAEYQATWNKQKMSLEVKTQGRYHSAENILDAGTEAKTVLIHERSRSSPSADFYSQGIPSPWSDSQTQQISSVIRGKTENRPQCESNHNLQLAPRDEGIVSGLTDHRAKPDVASSSLHPSSEQPSQPPQTKGLLPPPRTHLGPETTSSSLEFIAGTQAEPAALQPLSGPGSDADTHHYATTPAGSPLPAGMSGPDLSEEGFERPEETERPGATSPTDVVSVLAENPARSPSPQFAPLKLTDKPPAVSVRDDSPLRSEDEGVMDVSSPVRKVPVRIVHSETSSEREGRAYLPHNQASSFFQFPPQIPSLNTTEWLGTSLFSAYTRQDTGQAAVQESVPGSGSEEDAKREELARDIMGKDKSLVDILDQTGRKTTMDMMEGLFPQEEQILEEAQQRRRTSAGSRLPTSSPRNTDRREDDDVSLSAASSLVPSSSYYNTSAPKAELLIKMKDMQEQLEEQDSEDELDVDLASKKHELISSLAKKLEVLREARQSLQEDVEDNEALGREVEATVQRLCQPNQLDKFRMFVGDLDKVVSLLLSLSGRLARVENALNSLEEEAPPEEKRTLTEKRKLLMRQHEDAKELKENLDRREQLVSSVMEAHLAAESLDDYRHFVKMKSALIIEQRKLEDKIKLGEEQLKCLVDSLPLEQRPLL